MEEEEEYVAGCLLRLCFSVRSSNAVGTIDSDNEEEFLEENGHGSIVYDLRHKFQETDLRRSVTNVGRCFLSGSIAAAIIRNAAPASHAALLHERLLLFYMCSHAAQNLVCASCFSELLAAAQICSEPVHSAAQSAGYFSEYALNLKNETLQKLGKESARVFHYSLEVRDKFLKSCESQ